jgi:hypothetical protein
MKGAQICDKKAYKVVDTRLAGKGLSYPRGGEPFHRRLRGLGKYRTLRSYRFWSGVWQHVQRFCCFFQFLEDHDHDLHLHQFTKPDLYLDTSGHASVIGG